MPSLLDVTRDPFRHIPHGAWQYAFGFYLVEVIVAILVYPVILFSTESYPGEREKATFMLVLILVWVYIFLVVIPIVWLGAGCRRLW